MLAVELSVLPPAKLLPTNTAIDEPEHEDFKDSLLEALT